MRGVEISAKTERTTAPKTTMTHDLLIIGGGSAGYAAARTARDGGADVAIVDHGPLGGLCILRGCMPSKTLLRSSDIMALLQRAEEFGLAPVTARANLPAIMDRKARLIREFAEDRIQALRDPRLTLYEERASFLSPQEVDVGGQKIRAKAFVIATGSVPSRVPVPGLEDVGYLTSDELLDLRTRPKSLLVLGGGPVALELGQFFSRIGAGVTLIQRSPHLLSRHDEDVAQALEVRLQGEGMSLYCGTELQRFSQEDGMTTAHFLQIQNGEQRKVSAELVFQALGRRPNLDGLGLEAAGVDTRDGCVKVDCEMRTSQRHIFAVGDVTGLHDIVHIAIQQGEVAAHNVLRPAAPRRMDDRLVAEVVFTDPQVASVGLNEKACRAQGIPYLAASYPFADHGKALCLGEIHGHVKLLCRPGTGELIGAHIVGPEAGELIHALIAVMYYRGTVHDLLHMPHYHPTLAEIVTYPAEDLAGRLAQKQD